jgi:hypothetical protein
LAFSGIYGQADWATREWLAPKVQDVVLNSNATTFVLRRTARTVTGGTTIDGHNFYKKGTQGKWLANKADTYVHAVEQKFDAARWTRRIYTEPVALYVTDILDNSGDEQRRFDLVKNENMAAASTMADNFGTALYDLNYGNGGESGAQIHSLDHGIATNTATGDETSHTAVYGQVTRASTGDGATWNANIDDASDTFSMGVANDLFLSCSEGAMAGPTLITSNNKAAGFYYDELTPMQRSKTDELLGQAGFTAYIFNGIPWVIDSHVPSNDRGVGSISTEYVYMMDTRVIEINAHREAFFSWMGIKQPIDQWSVIGRYFFYGNVVVYNPRFCGKLTNLSM